MNNHSNLIIVKILRGTIIFTRAIILFVCLLYSSHIHLIIHSKHAEKEFFLLLWFNQFRNSE